MKSFGAKVFEMYKESFLRLVGPRVWIDMYDRVRDITNINK